MTELRRLCLLLLVTVALVFPAHVSCYSDPGQPVRTRGREANATGGVELFEDPEEQKKLIANYTTSSSSPPPFPPLTPSTVLPPYLNKTINLTVEEAANILGPGKKVVDRIELWHDAQYGSPRIFCMLYTLSNVFDPRGVALIQTWFKRCDGAYLFSNETNPDQFSIKAEVPGGEAYNNMWQKARSMWRYAATHLINDYDYFLIGGDDLYVIMENLRRFLLSEQVKTLQDQQKPLYLGYPMWLPTDAIRQQITFNSGGSGYLLNVPALKILMSAFDEPSCEPDAHVSWEDVKVAECLKPHGVNALDVRDEFGNLWQRFHPWTPSHEMETSNDKEHPEVTCCSVVSASFHYMSPEMMLAMDYLLYNSKSNPQP